MEMLALKHPLSNVLNALARSTEKQARGICAVLLVDADGKRLRCGAAPSLPPRWRKAIDGIAIGPHTGSCGAAAHSGQRVIAADIATDPAWADCRQLALPFGLRACTSVPIQSSKRELLGTFALFGRRPQPPTPAQLKLIDRAENLVAIILEHKRAEDALRESEERFRGLTELTGDRYWEQDAEFRFTWVTGRESDPNSEAESAMMIGKTRWETGVQLTSGTWEEHIRLLQAHKPYYDVELRRVDRSGREIFLVTSGEPVFDSEGRFKGYRGTGRDITARKRAEQLLRLEHTVARCVTDAESVSAALRAVIQAVCEAQDWDVGRYFRSDDQAGLLRFAESWNKPGTQFDLYIERSHSITYSPGVGIAGGVWQSGEPAWISDITRDPRASQKTIAAEAGMHGAFVFPVVSEGKTIGVLAFNSREIREPDERLLQAIRVIGAQIGQFVQRKRAEEVLRESEERFRSLIELSSDWYWEQDEHFRFTLVSDNLNEKMQRPGTVPLDKTRWDIPALNMTEQDWVAHRALLETRQPFRDLELHRRDRNGRLHIASVSGKPIFDAEGRFKGYRGVGQNITARRQAEEKIKNQALQQRLIAELGRQALASADLRDVLDRTMELVTITLRADYCHVLELDPSRTHLVYAAVAGWPPEWVGKETVSIRPGSRNEHLLKRGEPIIVEDFEKDARFLPLPDSHRGMRSGIQVPLMGAQGAFGVLSAHALEPRRFHEDDVSFLQSVANILAVAIERKSAEDRLAYLAQFDSLTGLPNRYLFHDRLLQTTAQAKRSGHPMAMLFVDLDRFKLVNDTLGHSAGDKLLQEAAQRLTQCIRGGDTAGRFGGDEFGAIVTELARPGDAGLVAQKILDALAQPFQVNGQETYISASIGITLFPGDGDNPETLVMNADTAMYRAKEQGRNTYQFFTREMNERALRRVQTEAALRWAIERREFVLHYQPKINLKTGTICGFEALLRWQPPGRGLVLPVEFIPVLEETGLIVPVGEWVVRGVCEQVRTWRDAGLPVPPVTVNLSARQFQQKDLESSVRRMLHETGVDSALIQFELTESLLMQDPEAAARTLRGLKESGVKTSVDDFGTGYSSLAYLKRFPLDSLKIDRSFVRDITSDPEDAAIMLAIIALARSLKLKVVAEGVETREQLDLLVRSGCDEMQGYLFSPATTPEDCAAMLSEGRRLA